MNITSNKLKKIYHSAFKIGLLLLATLSTASIAKSIPLNSQVELVNSELFMLEDPKRLLDVDDLNKITISVGVACGVADEVSFDDLLKLADASLYKAKRSGRNQVVIIDELPQEAV